MKNIYDIWQMKKWIAAARLRTLPLSLSGIILGTFLALSQGKFNWLVFLLACFTTISLQVLSNFANDYGDGIKGTDKNRTGEKRAVASGEISAKAMKNVMFFMAFLSILSAIILLAVAYLPKFYGFFIFYLFLGVASVWAAIQYTVGKSAYGYRALGDFFVLVFFGWVAVIGSFSLFTQEIQWDILLPASSIGLFSMAVLNLNNMRDIPQDKIAGKRTIAMILGFEKAKIYQIIIMLLPFLLGGIYMIIHEKFNITNWIFLVLLLPSIRQLNRVYSTKINKYLDVELKQTAIITLFFAVLFGLGLVGS